jgi:mRNA interferase RelE/StbE
LGWTIEYDPEAIKDLNKLNRSIRSEIFSYMQERIAKADTPRHFGKPLRNDKFGPWR